MRLPEQVVLHLLVLGVVCSSSSDQLLQEQRVTIVCAGAGREELLSASRSAK
jgi:hypothetical protein